MTTPKLYIALRPGRKIRLNHSGTTATILRARGQDSRGVDCYDVNYDLDNCRDLVHQACRDIFTPLRKNEGQPNPAPMMMPKREFAALLETLGLALAHIDRECGLQNGKAVAA